MSWAELIDRLSLEAGIEPFYFDVRGVRHETALATKVLVLEGLGCDVASAPAAESCLRAMHDEAWRRRAAPFLIARAERPVVDLYIPAERTGGSFACEVALEGRQTVHRGFRPEQLALAGTREIDGARIEHRRLELEDMPAGYHRLRLISDETVESILAAVPASCYLPPVLEPGHQRLWGLSAHVYALTSNENWGVGDFGDLKALCALAGHAGASAVAVNPFHALFPERPEEASPYSPSSRLFLNSLYVNPGPPSLPHAKSGLVDYPKVWRAKRAAFERSFRSFREKRAPKEFSDFVARGGETLRRFGTFSALEEKFGPAWPQRRHAYAAPGAPAVAESARENEERILFHQYLQFLADNQLGAAAACAKETGMDVGIVEDLAVGANPDGFDVWAEPSIFATLLRCGAPPDDFFPHGQEWGVVPFNPRLLKRNPEPLARLLSANMRHAGGLRIDHVIGLQRQFLVPLGGEASEGCYVRFPFEDLFGLLALESHRNACLVIGEDLGTVPEGFRERMQEANVFGCALLYFERSADGAFRAPGTYRVKTAASVATHDLPTLAGYWEGRDCELRRELGIYSAGEAEAALKERAGARAHLLEALKEAGLLPEAEGLEAHAAPWLVDAVHRFLAASQAQLFLAQLDDLSGEKDQLNVPGTTSAYPNWRRRLSLALEDSALAAQLHKLARLCAEQGRHRRPL